MFKPKEFSLTEDHLKLLRATYIGWEDCEFGAPAVDCKRPYGDSDVYSNIAEILGIKPQENGEFLVNELEHMHKLHKETQTALQILVRQARDSLIGDYQADKYSNNWEPV